MNRSRFSTPLLLGALLLTAGLLAGSGTVDAAERPGTPVPAGKIPKSFTRSRTGEEVVLTIPDRPHAPERPREGWCGECAIQQALLFHGSYYPQRDINKAGKPKHPDLYAGDIPVVLKNLRFRMRYGPSRSPLPEFLRWLREQIEAGQPVLVGMKIHPTKHENWILDHFTLAVGYDRSSFTINTTWNDQRKLSTEQVRSEEKGLSFENRHKRYYGIGILGPADRRPEEGVVRLFVTEEVKKSVHLIVKCEKLVPEREYVLVRSSALDGEGKAFVRFEARRAVHAYHDTIPTDRARLYRCVLRPLPEIFGDLEVRYFHSEAGALGTGEAIKPILEGLRSESGGLGERAVEAEAILSAVRNWVRKELDRLSALAGMKPVEALKEARRFAGRIRGLGGEAEVRKLIAGLEGGNHDK